MKLVPVHQEPSLRDFRKGATAVTFLIASHFGIRDQSTLHEWGTMHKYIKHFSWLYTRLTQRTKKIKQKDGPTYF